MTHVPIIMTKAMTEFASICSPYTPLGLVGVFSQGSFTHSYQCPVSHTHAFTGPIYPNQNEEQLEKENEKQLEQQADEQQLELQQFQPCRGPPRAFRNQTRPFGSHERTHLPQR